MRQYSLFIDFDFTITTDDVGNRFYTYFADGKNEALVKKWLNREISSYTCLTEEAKLCRGTAAQFVEYVNRFEIDPGFKSILNLCENRAIPLCVLSDGLDFYIEQIFNKYNLRDVKYFANRAEFTGDGLKIELPYWNAECPECGNCKGEHIKRLRRPQDTIIYIGDGFSDLCGVRQADLIFAKDDLARYLREEKIDFFEFENLTQVTDKLEGIISSAAKGIYKMRKDS